MFCSILACGQNGEIGLNGELPWEGQYPEDREFYEDKTELALRIGTRGAIAHFSPNRPCCLISTNVQKPRDCSYVYNWKKLTVEQIFADIDERIEFQKRSSLVALNGITQPRALLIEFTLPNREKF